MYGVDTDDSFHTSLVGEGRPLFRKPLADRSHEHLWVDAGEGYAEPVTPPLQTIAALMQHFCRARIHADRRFSRIRSKAAKSN